MKNPVECNGKAQPSLPGHGQLGSQKPGPFAIGLALLILYVVWGSTYLAIRVSVNTFPPLLMGSTRFALAGAILLVFLQALRGVRLTFRQCIDNSIGGFFMLLAGNGLVCWAVEEIPSGVATLIVALNPLFFVAAESLMGAWGAYKQSKVQENLGLGRASSPYAAFLNHLPKGWTQLGLVVGFLGLCILVAPSFLEPSQAQWSMARILALVGACLCWTIGSMYIRHVRHAADPMDGAGVQMLAGSVFLFVASYMLGEWSGFTWAQVAPEAWWAWTYLVLAGSLVGYTSFVWLMKHASPTLVSTYGYINPMIAVFLGWWVLGEQVGPRMLIASATIIAGVVMISWSKR
jgi:drug/metabolite transporter (DMT)-like permease